MSGIDWRMSAAFENVPRGDADLPEVTSLEGAVRAWTRLDDEHQAQATLTPERPVELDGEQVHAFTGQTIRALVDQLPD